jgi:tRNA U55 pseudouridine synthase TruB
MVVRLPRIQHHQQQVCRLAHGNDLTTSPCTAHTTWQQHAQARWVGELQMRGGAALRTVWMSGSWQCISR